MACGVGMLPATVAGGVAAYGPKVLRVQNPVTTWRWLYFDPKHVLLMDIPK